jgi:hypothetical protein
VTIGIIIIILMLNFFLAIIVESYTKVGTYESRT